jgi:hypothetical protein
MSGRVSTQCVCDAGIPLRAALGQALLWHCCVLGVDALTVVLRKQAALRAAG